MHAGDDVSKGVRERTRYRRLVVLLAVGVVILRAWSVSRWSWHSDDWSYMGRVADMSFVGYVFQDYAGHFMPGQFLLVWVVTTLAPLQHEVAVVITAAWAGVNCLLWGRALGELAGRRVRTLVPLALLSFTPLMIQSTIWWAASLQSLSLQSAFACAVYFTVRLVRSGGQRGGRGLLWSLILGLAMWDRVALLVIPVVFLVLLLDPGPWRETLRRHRRTVIGLVVVVLAYVALVVAGRLATTEARGGGAPGEATRDAGSVAGFYFDLLAHLVAPGLLGGPWGSLPTATDVGAQPGPVVVVASLVAMAVVILWTLLTRRRGWLVLAMVLSYALLAWGSVLLGNQFALLQWYRFGYERHAIDVFSVWCLALAVVLVLPATGRGERVGRRVPSITRSRLLPALGLCLVAISLGVGNWQAVERLGTSPAKPWLANVTAGLDQDSVVDLVDTYAPPPVLQAAWWGEEARLSAVLSPLGDRIRFQGPAERLSMVTREGHVRPVTVDPVSRSMPGPVRDCGYPVAPGEPVRVRMADSLYAWSWGVQVRGYTDEDTRLRVEVDGDRFELDFSRGLNADKFAHQGKVDVVKLSVPQDGADVCVSDIFAGPFVLEEPAGDPSAGAG